MSVSSTPHLPLVPDHRDWERVVCALADQDLAALYDLVVEGAVLSVPSDADVVVEEDVATLVFVRVRSGAHRGAAGWVPVTLLPSTVRASGRSAA